MSRKKAQAAIEFMTTYGWALMAILVAVGALSYFDFLNADRYKSIGCNTGTQIQCLEVQLRENGAFSINLRNNYPVDVRIQSISLRNKDGAYVELSVLTIDPNFNLINRGGTKLINYNPNNDLVYDEGSKQTLDIKVEFSRDIGNPPRYNILGTLTVRIAP